MCICISCRYPFNSERGITIYLQFCSFELELSILQQGVVFLLTVFELMLFEFVWCYFLWRYLKIHGMEIESYCKIKRFLKRLQIALQIRILYFSTHHNTNTINWQNLCHATENLLYITQGTMKSFRGGSEMHYLQEFHT